MQSEHGFLDVGPIRVAAIVEFEAVGRHVQAQRREFRRLPSLRSIGFELPQTRVTLLGWKLSFEELEDHARALEQLQLGTDLFRALEAAETRTGRRFRERYHQGGG